MSVDAKIYAHEKLSVIYIYASYHVIFLLFIIRKRIYPGLIYMQDHYTSEYQMAMVLVISKLYCHQSEE